MRVLVTVTFNRNQLESHLAPLLALDDVERVVLVADQRPQPSLPGVDVVVPPGWLTKTAGRALAKTVTAVWVAGRFRPDWVFGFNLVPHGVNAYIAARSCGAKALYHQIGGPREWLGGGWDSDNGILGRLRRPSRLVERSLLSVIRRADAVCVMGEHGREMLTRYGVDPRHVFVVPAAARHAAVPTSEGHQKWDVVTVGELLPVKRTADFLAAVAQLRREGRQLRVAVVGSGPLRESLEERARVLGVDDAVSFLGFRSDVADICARSRLFVLTSAYEGLSIALVDAMASGIPAVSSDVGEVRSVIEDGISGLLYPPGDVGALVDALRRLLDDSALRERVGRAARERALRVAGLDAVRDALDTVLHPDRCVDERPALRLVSAGPRAHG